MEWEGLKCGIRPGSHLNSLRGKDRTTPPRTCFCGISILFVRLACLCWAAVVFKHRVSTSYGLIYSGIGFLCARWQRGGCRPQTLDPTRSKRSGSVLVLVPVKNSSNSYGKYIRCGGLLKKKKKKNTSRRDEWNGWRREGSLRRS